MSKMKTTAYANNVNVERIPGSRCIAVTVDDTGVAANSEGKKIVPAGTIVGGNVFADPANKVADANNPAKGDLESTGTNNDITVTNLTGSVIKVQLVDPAGNNKTLGLDLTTDTIKVMLATGGTGAITSTAADVIALLNANPITKAILVAANKGTDTGESVVTAVAAVTIDGSAVKYPEGVLLNDVDVTYGPKSGAMIVSGIVDLAKLTAAPSALARKALAGRIVFAN